MNLGILAHVDAGKTSLTERLLYAAGVIDEIGRVDDGNTQTDSLALERERGITIKSSVVSFVVDDITLNLIDTPGHPDFIAEVERVLSVLDGAVLVISAVEGVQAQTRVLMRTLQRLGIPTIIFVNKIDRGGAHDERTLQTISEKLTSAIVPMGQTRDVSTRNADFAPYGATDVAFTARLTDLLVDHDDALLAAYIDDETAASYTRLRDELAVQAQHGLVHPVFFGSAITGAGVDALTLGITELLPAIEGNADGRVDGTIFKVDRGPAGERIAYVRLFTGTVRTRDRVPFGRDDERKVTAISVFEHGTDVQRPSVGAGHIAKLWGLADIRVGDRIGPSKTTTAGHHFAPPTLEAVIVPRRRVDTAALHVALGQLAEQDPLINLRQNDARHELFVSLYGVIQKEVLQETLRTDFGIDVDFRETITICIERPVRTGAAVEVLGEASNPFLATVGLRIEPAAINAGVDLRVDAELASIPLFIYKTVEDFRNAIDDTVHQTLQQGLSGWRITDCTVTITHSGYTSPASTAGDFRKLTPLVLMDALKQAGTVVCEPIHRFHLEIPTETLGPILPVLARLHAVPHTPTTRGSTCALDGDIPAARVHDLQRQLPALTRGEGLIEWVFDHYQPVHGTIPTRPRTDLNPLDRKEYLLHVLRRV
jgi:ribosomal protection tetracycline resistance protein